MSNKVSVIIPTHNCEKYIVRCIESVMSQTYPDIEVIVVENNSEDNTPALCDEYDAKHQNLTIIHTKEKGVSRARNLGLSKATGDYIMFVDSDDWLAIDAVEKLVAKIKEDESDLVFCGYYNASPNDIKSCKALPFEKRDITNILVSDAPAFAHSKLFAKSMVKYLHFPEDISIGEDTATILPLISFAKKMSFLDEPLYYYFQNKDSALGSIFDNPEKMFSYAKSGLIALERANPAHVDKLACGIARRILNNRTWFLKHCYADVIEFVKTNMMKYFENNNMIINSPYLREIISFKTKQVVPSIAYYDNFGKQEWSKSQKACIEQLKTSGFFTKVMELSEKNCDIYNAPASVKSFYEQGQFEKVGDYFKLKKIHETGGVALSKNIYVIKPFGEPRTTPTFFSLIKQKEISHHVFGSIANTKVVEQVLETYSEIYEDQSASFSERVRQILISYYRYNGETWLTYLEDATIAVHGCESFSDFFNRNSLSTFVDDMLLPLIGSDYVFLSKAVMDQQNLIRDNQYNRIRELESGKSGHHSDAEFQLMKHERDIVINSTSWKFTRPLRFLGRVARKVFKRG